MSRRWKFEEDVFLATYHCEMLEYHIARFDIKCAKEEVGNRVKHLKKKGVWEMLQKFSERKAELEWEFNCKLELEERKALDLYKDALGRRRAAA